LPWRDTVETPEEKCEPSTDAAQENAGARGGPPDPEGRSSGTEQVSANPLDKAFVARVAIYAAGLSAGLGIKALDRALLLTQLTDAAQKTALKSRVMDRVTQAVSDAGVTYGLDAEALSDGADAFMAALETGEDEMVSRKIAEGEAPTPGEDARLEYPLNPDDLPMHKVQDVPENSPRTWVRMVREGETLVQVLRAQPGQSGVDVKGNPVEPKKPKEVSLEGVTGERTVADGDRLTAESDGACEENAQGKVRVVPEVEVESVDSATGNLPEAGVSNANVLVRRAVCSDASVTSSEVVFVGAGPEGGAVEQSARLTAKSLVVNGPLFGPYDTRSSAAGERNTIEVQETCAAQTIDRRAVSARLILVSGDARLSSLEADEAVRVDGSVVGGEVICRQLVTVGGDLGTEEGGSRTCVMVPPPGEISRRERGLRVALHKQQKALAEVQDRQAKLEAAAAKRATADPYWSQLLSGEYRKPENPIQARSLRQFRDLLNARKVAERSAVEIGLAVKQMQDELSAQAGEADGTGIVVRVGGRVHLDASFEASLLVEDEDALALQLTYTVEGKHFRNHTLQDLKGELAKQMKAYLEKESAQVDARRQAINEMFKDADQRPAGPEIRHKRFELPFTWTPGEEEGEDGDEGEDTDQLQITTTAWVDSGEPDKLCVQSAATPRQTLSGLEVRMQQEGPKVKFLLDPCDAATVRWRQDPEAKVLLKGIVVRGVDAWRFLVEKQVPAVESEQN
jgi:uncharacterized protein (DUF342 family)